MSMTIHSTSYADIRFKSMKTNDLSNDGKESSSSSTKISTANAGAAVAETSSQQSTEQADPSVSLSSPRVDTVEISEEGRAFSAQIQAQKSNESTAQEYQYESENLSEYTNSELKTMYYRGEITFQEYEEETGETLE